MIENNDKKTKEFIPEKKYKALQDFYKNAGTLLVKKGEIFTESCNACAKNLIANKQAIEINE